MRKMRKTKTERKQRKMTSIVLLAGKECVGNEHFRFAHLNVLERAFRKWLKIAV
jgi:hypothetical protein